MVLLLGKNILLLVQWAHNYLKYFKYELMYQLHGVF